MKKWLFFCKYVNIILFHIKIWNYLQSKEAKELAVLPLFMCVYFWISIWNAVCLFLVTHSEPLLLMDYKTLSELYQ